MKSVKLSLLLTTIILCSCVHYDYYVGVPNNLEGSSPHTTLHHWMDVKVKYIDGKNHSMKGIFANDKHSIYMTPGYHEITFTYCNCSGNGYTLMEGEHTIKYQFEDKKIYLLRLVPSEAEQNYDFSLQEINSIDEANGKEVARLSGSHTKSKYW